MREVDDALEFMKEEFKTRIEACEERQRDFERKQVAMKDQVLKFEKFIQGIYIYIYYIYICVCVYLI